MMLFQRSTSHVVAAVGILVLLSLTLVYEARERGPARGVNQFKGADGPKDRLFEDITNNTLGVSAFFGTICRMMPEKC
jgi:hypothetical protein